MEAHDNGIDSIKLLENHENDSNDQLRPILLLGDQVPVWIPDSLRLPGSVDNIAIFGSNILHTADPSQDLHCQLSVREGSTDQEHIVKF